MTPCWRIGSFPRNWVLPKVEVQLPATFLIFSILYFRNPLVLDRPEFWAEDATSYFRDALEMGWRALFYPLGGYQNLIPRLIAGGASLVSPLYVPAVYAYSSFLLTSIALAWFCRPGFRWLVPSPWLRLGFGVLAAIGPGITETSQAICNIHTIFAFWWFLLILEREVLSTARWIGMTLIALSTPEIPASIPLLVVFWLYLKDRRALLILYLVLGCLLANGIQSHVFASGAYALRLDLPELMVRVASQRFALFHFFIPFFGPSWAGRWLTASAEIHWFLLLVAFVVSGCLLLKSPLDRISRATIGALWLATPVYFAMMWVARPYLWNALERASGKLFWAGRYGFFSWNVAALSMLVFASALWRGATRSKKIALVSLVAAFGGRYLFNAGTPYARTDIQWPKAGTRLARAIEHRLPAPNPASRRVHKLPAHPNIRFSVLVAK